MLPEWVMIRKLLELYYHRWQLWRDRQVMLRGRDKRLWHYVWRVKDSQSKLELLLLDQYFSVQHLSWLLVRGFCRYEHWESKIKLKKNDCCCSLTCGLLKLFRFQIHNSFFVGQTPMTWKQDKTNKLWIILHFPCPFPSFYTKRKRNPVYFYRSTLNSVWVSSDTASSTLQNNICSRLIVPFNIIAPWGQQEDCVDVLPNGPKGWGRERGRTGTFWFEKYMIHIMKKIHSVCMYGPRFIWCGDQVWFIYPADSLAWGSSRATFIFVLFHTFIHSFRDSYLFIFIVWTRKVCLSSFHARSNVYHPC